MHDRQAGGPKVVYGTARVFDTREIGVTSSASRQPQEISVSVALYQAAKGNSAH